MKYLLEVSLRAVDDSDPTNRNTFPASVYSGEVFSDALTPEQISDYVEVAYNEGAHRIFYTLLNPQGETA